MGIVIMVLVVLEFNDFRYFCMLDIVFVRFLFVLIWLGYSLFNKYFLVSIFFCVLINDISIDMIFGVIFIVLLWFDMVLESG